MAYLRQKAAFLLLENLCLLPQGNLFKEKKNNKYNNLDPVNIYPY